jgi:hypothetical protein
MLKTLARWLAVAALVLLIAFALFSREGAGWRWLTKGGWHSTARISSLSPQEQEWARIAWRYFENNTQPQTGLVNGSDKQPRVTLWQMGDTLIALLAARELDLVKEAEFDARLTRLLGTLNRLTLTDTRTPGRLYSSRTATPIDFSGKPVKSGWSAKDLARLMLALRPMLPGLEFGWQPPGVPSDVQKTLRERAEGVWLSQKTRWERDKVLTARADFYLAQAPWHVEDTVWGNGYAWNTLGDDGRYYPRLAQVTTKAVFVLWTLWETEYTDALMAVTTHLNNPEQGWFEGRVEATGDINPTLTLSTNAMVLEALLYKHNAGPLFENGLADDNSYFSRRTTDQFNPPGLCLPGEKAVRTAP